MDVLLDFRSEVVALEARRLILCSTFQSKTRYDLLMDLINESVDLTRDDVVMSEMLRAGKCPIIERTAYPFH